jgi:hypothetical protein
VFSSWPSLPSITMSRPTTQSHPEVSSQDAGPTPPYQPALTTTNLRTQPLFFTTEVLPKYDLPSDSKCTCCLDFLTTDVVKMKACGHRFHATCIVTRFQGHSTNEMKRTCPNCHHELYAPERGAVRRFRLDSTRTAPSLPAIGNSLQSGSRSLAWTRGTAPLDGQDDEMIPEELIDRVLALEATRNDALQGMRNLLALLHEGRTPHHSPLKHLPQICHSVSSKEDSKAATCDRMFTSHVKATRRWPR